MCSTANCVLPLRRTCEVWLSQKPQHTKYITDCFFVFLISSNFHFYYKVLASPGKLCGGVSMSTNFPGARSHGTPQDTEVDVAWQELMAITELQVTLSTTHYQICQLLVSCRSTSFCVIIVNKCMMTFSNSKYEAVTSK